MNNKQLDAIFADANLARELELRLGTPPAEGRTPPGFFEGRPPVEAVPRVNVLRDAASVNRGLEAIVLRYGRPSLLVKNGTFEVPDSDTWKALLYPTKTFLDRAIASVGRVELINHEMAWAGTGWVISEGAVITNRHVADLFAEHNGDGFVFSSNPDGVPFGARIDFKEEHLLPNSH